MKPKLLLAGAAIVAVLGVGAAVSWGASSQPMPAVWSHDVGGAGPGQGMAAMHRGLDQADIDRMVEICEQAMEVMHDDMMSDGSMMDGGMMGSDGMMGGGMMGP